MVHFAVVPFAVFAVIVAFPKPLAVTFPELLTVATDVELLDHVTFADGVTVADS